MSFYEIIRPLLFLLDAETSHDLSLKAMHTLEQNGLLKYLINNPTSKTSIDKKLAKTTMGISFPNALGLAAGLDKNGAYIDALSHFGFGFIEIGTVTPKPQAGNVQPRLFRIAKNQAILNRMGFNNHGMDVMIENIKKSKWVREGGILGINIGKNATTAIEDANQDYLYCLEKAYPYASYITVNISSPNTQNLRSLQTGEALKNLLHAIKTKQEALAKMHQIYKPVVLKIAPDLLETEVETIAKLIKDYQFDGVIASNTTIDKSSLDSNWHTEAGGVSGAVLTQTADLILQQLKSYLQDTPIIGVGGIMNAEQAMHKLALGADLIQVYSGLIYKGPALAADILQAMAIKKT